VILLPRPVATTRRLRARPAVVVLGALALSWVSSAAPGATAVTAARPAAGSGPLRLIIEPGAGMSPIYALLSSARHTLDMVMYELSDNRAEEDLAADAARGVKVRVILDRHYEESANDPALSYLSAHGVVVHWAGSRFDLTHEKSFVVDRTSAVVMTLNLTERYYASTRDVAVVDTEPGDISAIESAFDTDWSDGAATAPSGVDLLWSPGSEQPLLDMIGAAKRSLLVENEEMDDSWITAALVAAARRGVAVEVVMTQSSSWNSAFDELAAAGVEVRVYSPSAPLYIHAKVLVVDRGGSGARGFVGSENFSVASLLYNRELGIVTTDPAVVSGLASMVEGDGAAAVAWR